MNFLYSDLAYHPRGWLIQRAVRNAANGTSTSDRITTWIYDGVGDVTKVTHPVGDYEIYGYDDAHRLTDITNRLGEHLHYVLDNAGHRAEEDFYTSTGTLKHKVLRDYDALGRLFHRYNTNVSPASTAMTFLYDDNGNVQTATDGRGYATDNAYDPRNRLVQVEQDAASGGLHVFTNYTYDNLDHMKDVMDPQGLFTHYTIDALNNQTRLSSPDTGITAYAYDAAGNRISQSDARTPSVTTNYTYDALNRLTAARYPATPALDVTYTWDAPAAGCVSPNRLSKGRLSTVADSSGSTTFCYSRYGDIALKTQTIGTAVFPVGYVWNKDARLNSMTVPDGAVFSYVRDNNNRIKTVKYQLSGQPGATTLVSAVSYNPFGPVTKVTYGNGRSLSRTYDLDYAIKTVVDASAMGDGLNLTYSRDRVGNITQIKTTSTIGNKFIYDSLNRLTQVNDLGANPLWRYTYDGTGNRTTERQGLGAELQYTYPGDSHHLLNVGDVPEAQRAYDGAGNTTSIGAGTASEVDFHYDDTNRMDQFQSGSQTWQYLANALGQRVMKSKTGDAGQTVKTVYDEQGHRLGEFNNANTTIADYIWLDDLPVGVVDGSSHAVNYIEPDHLGTPRLVIDPAANDAIWSWPILGEPFGNSQPVNLNGSTFALNLRFPGQSFDGESGFNYNNARYFDSTTGRYLETDPIGFRAGTSSYAYASSSPAELIDPLGLFSMSVTCPNCSKANANKTQRAIQDKCNDLGRITNDALRNCMQRRCKFGHVIAECDTPDCSGHRGYSNCLNGINSISDAGEVHLCLSSPPDGEGGVGGAVIHEWAHTCNWTHGDGMGIYDNHPEDPIPRCIPQMKPGFVW